MNTSKAQRGGAGRGQGRKPLEPGQETVTAAIKMSAPQRDKLLRLGGAKWVRGKIDAAREPVEKAEPQGD